MYSELSTMSGQANDNKLSTPSPQMCKCLSLSFVTSLIMGKERVVYKVNIIDL